MITLEAGRTRTWRLPRFSALKTAQARVGAGPVRVEPARALRALFMSPADSLLRKQSLSTETRTMAPERGGPHAHGGQAVGAERRGREQPRRSEERRSREGLALARELLGRCGKGGDV